MSEILAALQGYGTSVLVGLRAANVLLCALALLGLCVRINDTWRDLRRGGRITRVGLMILLFGGVVSSILKYLRHAPVDISIVIVTTGVALVAIGTYVSRNDPA